MQPLTLSSLTPSPSTTYYQQISSVSFFTTKTTCKIAQLWLANQDKYLKFAQESPTGLFKVAVDRFQVKIKVWASGEAIILSSLSFQAEERVYKKALRLTHPQPLLVERRKGRIDPEMGRLHEVDPKVDPDLLSLAFTAQHKKGDESVFTLAYLVPRSVTQDDSFVAETLAEKVRQVGDLSRGLTKLHSLGLISRSCNLEQIIQVNDRAFLGAYGHIIKEGEGDTCWPLRPYYSAPEEIEYIYEGGPLPGRSCDIWQLGVLFLSLIFPDELEIDDGPIDSETLRQCQKELIEMLRRSRWKGSAGKKIAALIFSMVQIDPSKRPSAEEVCHSLDKIGLLLCKTDHPLPDGLWEHWLDCKDDYIESAKRSKKKKYSVYFEWRKITIFSCGQAIVRGPLLGKGKNKRVYEGILLNDKITVVALAKMWPSSDFEDLDIREEIKVNRLFKDAHRVVQLKTVLNFESIKTGRAAHVLVFDLCNTTLENCVDRGLLSGSMRLNLLKCAVASIEELHRLDRVHSDLSRSNLLVNFNSFHNVESFVSDLGASYKVGGPQDHFIFTPVFGSPEAWRHNLGRGLLPGLEQDIWSLGILFFQLVFNRSLEFEEMDVLYELSGDYQKISSMSFESENKKALILEKKWLQIELQIEEWLAILDKYLRVKTYHPDTELMLRLIEDMLNRDPAARPKIAEVRERLNDILR